MNKEVQKLPFDLDELQEHEPQRVLSHSEDAGEHVGEKWEKLIDLGLIEEAREVRRRLEQRGRIREFYPSNPKFKSLNWSGIEFTTEGRFEDAIESFEKAQSIAKTKREEYSSLANTIDPLIRLGQHEKAKEVAQKSLALAHERYQEQKSAWPTLQNAYYNRFLVFLMPSEDDEKQKGRFQQADKVLSKIRDLFGEELKNRKSNIHRLLDGTASLDFAHFKQQSKIWNQIENTLVSVKGGQQK